MLASFFSLSGAENGEEKDEYRFRFRFPRDMAVRSGETPTQDKQDHGHNKIPEAEFAKRTADVIEFWKRKTESGQPITKADIVELYHRAGDFKVVHGILNKTILPSQSKEIGRLRQEIHMEVLKKMAASKEFGSRMGVNDFGSGADPEKVNAKTDIDFTPYASLQGVTGAEMVARYQELFRQVTASYGKAVDPGQMDIVAHQYEATIPDWRQNVLLSDFTARLTHGLGLLGNNSEAYFLEGAFLQQVMRRSADMNAKTFTWFEFDANQNLKTVSQNAAQVAKYFYAPDIRARYAWGASVGNWHFFHAHSDDLVAQAKYVLRSLDDGAGMLLGRVKPDEYENLNNRQRQDVVDALYGKQFSETQKNAFKALLDTAVMMRQLKSKDQLKLGEHAGELKAYGPLIDFEKSQARGVELSDETLLKLARDRFQKSANKMLLQNNLLTARSRLKDWLSPDLEVGKDLDVLDPNGRWRKVRISSDTVKRLQYSAYFELKAALSTMDDSQISRIQDANPKYRNEIEIIRRLIKKQKELLKTPEGLSKEEGLTYRQKVADEVLKDYDYLKEVFRKSGYNKGMMQSGKLFWARGDQVEDWLKRAPIDALLDTPQGKAYLPHLHKMREQVDHTNKHLLGPKWMMRFDGGTSVVEVLKSYVREGELNQAVFETALWEGVSFFPMMGTVFAVQGGLSGVSTLVLVQFVPGYGQILLTGNFVKGLVELGGMLIFEPLKQDRVLLAYQGYLEEGGWGLFTSGQKERVESPRPHLLLPVDRDRTMGLDERREKMYQFFNNRVISHVKHDYRIPQNMDLPPELAQKEFEYLDRHIAAYVNGWWNGEGDIFGEYDVLTVHRAEDIRPDLMVKLKKDYMVGKNRDLQRQMQEREEKLLLLSEGHERIASEDIGIDEEGKTLRGEGGPYEEAGELIMATALDAMPHIKPSVEIIVAPFVEKEKSKDLPDIDHIIKSLNFRAKVYASMKEFPGPWKIEWKVSKPIAQGVEGSTSELEFSSPTQKNNASEAGTITITAIATNYEGKEIARGSIQVEVEKIKIDKDKEKDEDKDEDDSNGEKTKSDLIDKMKDLVKIAGNESSEVDENCREGERNARNASDQVNRLENRTNRIDQSVQQIESRAEKLLEDFASLQELRETIEEASQIVAEARDTARNHALKTCEAVLAMRDVTSSEERQEYFNQAQEGRSKVEEARTQAREAYKRANKAAQSIKDLWLKFSELIKDMNTVKSNLNAIVPDIEAAESTKSRSKVHHTQSKVFNDKLKQTQGSGGDILKEAKELEDPKLMDTLENLYGKIVAQKERVVSCPAELQSSIETLVEKLTQFETEISDIKDALAAVKKSAFDKGVMDALKDAVDMAQATMGVLDIFMETIEDRFKDALKCEELAKKEMHKPITVLVPNVEGMTIQQATQVLDFSNLGIKMVAGKPAPTEEKAHKVDTQYPVVGSRAKPNETVIVVIFGAYTDKVVVPDVQGKSVKEARALLGKDLILAPYVGEPAQTKSEAFTIQSQDPIPYLEVDKNSTVTVRVRGEYVAKKVVPDVTGLYSYQAKGVIESSGFGMRKVVGDPAPNKENESVVYGQSPVSGHEATAEQKTVTVYVYGETEEEEVPVVIVPEEEPLEEFYVACSLFFPRVPEEAPEGEKYKEWVIRYLKRLNPMGNIFVISDQKVFIHVSGKALKLYPKGYFYAEKELSTPFFLTMESEEGKIRFNGAFLMKVEWVFNSFQEMASQYPMGTYSGIKAADGRGSSSANSPSILYLEIRNEEGTFSGYSNEEGGKGSFNGGPLFEGWSRNMRQKNINFLITFIENFDCFIATTVYNSWEDPRIDTLRAFRDKVMLKSESGSHLVMQYYRLGSHWAASLQRHPVALSAAGTLLNGVVSVLDYLDLDDPTTQNVLQKGVTCLDWVLTPWLKTQDYIDYIDPLAMPLNN